MRSRNDLSVLQLQIVMHIANGMTFEEIASELDRSLSYIKQNANTARYKMNARTLPQLVSMVIAEGLLEWKADERIVNGELQPHKTKSLVDRLSEMSDG